MNSVAINAVEGMRMILTWFGQTPCWVQEVRSKGQVLQHSVILPSRSTLRLNGSFHLKSQPYLNPVVETRRNGNTVYFKDGDQEVPLKQLPSRLCATVLTVAQSVANPTLEQNIVSGKEHML
ncbi:MAG: hypothetical protein Q7S08_01320 [bacterium]|nr:hypothetical protein [bacterium]